MHGFIIFLFSSLVKFIVHTELVFDSAEQMNIVSPSSVCLHDQNLGGSQSIISSTLHCDLRLVRTLDESVFWEGGVFDLF